MKRRNFFKTVTSILGIGAVAPVAKALNDALPILPDQSLQIVPVSKVAVFNGRRRAYTNPLQDVQADILTVEAGLDMPPWVNKQIADDGYEHDIIHRDGKYAVRSRNTDWSSSDYYSYEDALDLRDNIEGKGIYDKTAEHREKMTWQVVG